MHDALMLLSALKEAGRRTDELLIQYGVELEWKVQRHGLKLTATWGADKVERHVSWTEIETTVNSDSLLLACEKSALAGISS
ncbi:MAG: hypothetical protein CML69_00895 [Rhodobacteraceae bacterium]|nr:hypothetical protein [Paracoccaceae bacterium]